MLYFTVDLISPTTVCECAGLTKDLIVVHPFQLLKLDIYELLSNDQCEDLHLLIKCFVMCVSVGEAGMCSVFPGGEGQRYQTCTGWPVC